MVNGLPSVSEDLRANARKGTNPIVQVFPPFDPVVTRKHLTKYNTAGTGDYRKIADYLGGRARLYLIPVIDTWDSQKGDICR